jgi:O-antigen ligase
MLHFKRGAWLSFILAAVLIAFVSGRRKALVGLIVFVLALLAVPAVRDRMQLLHEEGSDRTGGRRVLWTRVAPALLHAQADVTMHVPALIGDYPLGMGWKATRHEDFLPYADYIQPRLNHLHNNILQVTLEMGWIGAGIWLYWMGLSLFVMFGGYRRFAASNVEAATIALGAAGGCTALLLNGMVENNFGDTEIFMTMIFLMALSALIWSLPGRAGGRSGP